MSPSGFLGIDFLSSVIGSLTVETTRTVHCFLSYVTYPFFQQKNVNINYLLFTKKNPKKPCDLQPTKEALDKCNFNPKVGTKVLIAGYTPSLPPHDLKFVLKDKILEAGDYNVIVHNWTAYNDNYDIIPLGYVISGGFSFYAALKMSAWIRYLQVYKGADPETFHLLGQSTGGEVASFVGKTTCNLGKITFMDAASAIFRYLLFLQPEHTDALFTEEIHCSGGYTAAQGDGYVEPIADIDYYMNGGRQQPKCSPNATFIFITQQTGKVITDEMRVRCNHYSVYEYYFASFMKNCKFLGLICNSYEDYKSGKCSPKNSTQCEMGFYAKRNKNLPPLSKCFITTSVHEPYCLTLTESNNTRNN